MAGDSCCLMEIVADLHSDHNKKSVDSFGIVVDYLNNIIDILN